MGIQKQTICIMECLEKGTVWFRSPNDTSIVDKTNLSFWKKKMYIIFSLNYGLIDMDTTSMFL